MSDDVQYYVVCYTAYRFHSLSGAPKEIKLRHRSRTYAGAMKFKDTLENAQRSGNRMFVEDHEQGIRIEATIVSVEGIFDDKYDFNDKMPDLLGLPRYRKVDQA